MKTASPKHGWLCHVVYGLTRWWNRFLGLQQCCIEQPGQNNFNVCFNLFVCSQDWQFPLFVQVAALKHFKHRGHKVVEEEEAWGSTNDQVLVFLFEVTLEILVHSYPLATGDKIPCFMKEFYLTYGWAHAMIQTRHHLRFSRALSVVISLLRHEQMSKFLSWETWRQATLGWVLLANILMEPWMTGHGFCTFQLGIFFRFQLCQFWKWHDSPSHILVRISLSWSRR